MDIDDIYEGDPVEFMSKADEDSSGYDGGKSEHFEIEYDSLEMLDNRLRKSNSPTIFQHEFMWKCLQSCSLFREDYKFQKDDIILLWIAQGFVPVPSKAATNSQMVEDTGRLYFEEFEHAHIFQSQLTDYSTPQPRYTLNRSIFHLLQEHNHEEYARMENGNSYISEKTLHCSLSERNMNPGTLEYLYRAKRLLTLYIFHEQGTRSMHQVPRQLFLKLPFLKVVDFSHTSISELPNSIGKLKDLRYLNLSGTPITLLPDSLCSLSQVQTLKLSGCLKLVSLPKDMRKLINLRHLDLDVACLLVSVPPGLGDLIELQSLPAFVVGRENGCHITELRHMVNLRGSLRILGLENVYSAQEAKEAALDGKKFIHKLELQWAVLENGYEVLENLKPHTELRELQIVGYGGTNFPSWIGDPLFLKLRTITIHDCRSCTRLPFLGELPFLFQLCISEMPQVKVIDHHFWGRSSHTIVFGAFPQLENLTLNGFPGLQEWTGMEEGDLPCLQKMNIIDCSKLISLPKLTPCKSLQQIEISLCPSLESLTMEGLPTTLQYLVIVDCPLLKESFHRGEGGLLLHIPTVWIDYKQISAVTSTSGQTPNTKSSSSLEISAEEEFEQHALSMEQNTRTDFAMVPPQGNNLLSLQHPPMITEEASDTGSGSPSMQAPKLEELVHVKDTVEAALITSTEFERKREGQSSDKPQSEEELEVTRGGGTHENSKPYSLASGTWSDEETQFNVESEASAITGSKEMIYKSLLFQVHHSHLLSRELDKMKSKLDTMRLFLLEAEQLGRHQNNCRLLKTILAQIRVLIYDADDIVLDCRIRADYEDIFPVHRYTLHGRLFRRTTRNKIREINKRIKEIETQLKTYLTSISLMIKATEERSSTSTRPGRSFSHHSSISGFENVIMEKIMGFYGVRESPCQIGIVGMAGVGKTILAGKLHSNTADYFQIRIWVTVTQTGTQNFILTSILDQLMDSNGIVDSYSMHDKLTHIEERLCGMRCLIVMDDVWTMDSEWWRLLSEYLPQQRCIIITTRNEHVSRSMGAKYMHKLRNLDEGESWSLFSKVAFSASKKKSEDSEFEKVGKEILKKCQGIPQAITSMAGLLATKSQSLDQWEEVNTNFSKYLEETSFSTNLQRSYDDLPANLKQCILCFSIYPRDSIISAEHLVYWWVGEEFVLGNGQKTAIEVGFECLSELVSRCLVEVEEGYSRSRRISKCKMHNVVRAMIIKMAIEEAFISSDGALGNLDINSRHLGYKSTLKIDNSYTPRQWYESMLSPLRWYESKLRAGGIVMITTMFEEQLKVNNSKLRAFLMTTEDQFLSKWELRLDTINSLRVFHLSQTKVDYIHLKDLLRFIKSQKRLAYLHIQCVGLKTLPAWLRRHRNLQILVINECDSLKRLPACVAKLQNLVVLDVQGCRSLQMFPGLGRLTKLQILRGLRIQSFGELKNLKELRELTIELRSIQDVYVEDNGLSGLNKLKVLSIDAGYCNMTALDMLNPPSSLMELSFRSYWMDNMPEWFTPASLPKLRYLEIHAETLNGALQRFSDKTEGPWKIVGLCLKDIPTFKWEDWECIRSCLTYLRYAQVIDCEHLESSLFRKNHFMGSAGTWLWENEEDDE